MVINSKLGKLQDIQSDRRNVERVELEWFESDKRILHKRTDAGRDIILKFLKDNPGFTQDDVIFINDSVIICIELLACDAIVVPTPDVYNTAALCYEIGNKHLPLFYEQDTLLIPFDLPFYNWLLCAGYKAEKKRMKLLTPLKTTVTAHRHSQNGSSLFSKLVQLTNSQNAE